MTLRKLILGAIANFIIVGTSYGQTQNLAAEDSCVTASTNNTGKRYSCDKYITIGGPGLEIREDSIALTKQDGRGSEHYCNITYNRETDGWENWIESVTVHLHARSPKGYHSGRGRIACKVSAVARPK